MVVMRMSNTNKKDHISIMNAYSSFTIRKRLYIESACSSLNKRGISSISPAGAGVVVTEEATTGKFFDSAARM